MLEPGVQGCQPQLLGLEAVGPDVAHFGQGLSIKVRRDLKHNQSHSIAALFQTLRTKLTFTRRQGKLRRFVKTNCREDFSDTVQKQLQESSKICCESCRKSQCKGGRKRGRKRGGKRSGERCGKRCCKRSGKRSGIG